VLDESIRRLTEALRPWTIDFHVAQNDATVHGTGSHDKTGRHCQVNDPNGKLNIAYHAGYWLRDENGELTKATRHICWDGCMFPNEVMMKQQTWNNILATMIAVRDGHGWSDGRPARAGKPTGKPTPSITTKAARPAKVKTAKAKVKTAKVKAKAKVKIKRGAGKKPAKRPVKAKVKSKPAAAKKSAKVKSRKPARKAAAKKPAKKKTGRRK
jgi:hypothetical protein